MTKQAEIILNYLRVFALGKNNAKTIKYLCGVLGLKRRTIERATEEIREQGQEILCSETKVKNAIPGLYLAEKPEEIDQYYNQIESRIRMMCIHRAQIRKASLMRWGRKPAKQLSFLDVI